MKTVLLENNNLASKDIKDWATSFDAEYKEVNSEVTNYDISHDLWLFAMLINPTLTKVLTSSDFPSEMPYEAYSRHGKDFDGGNDRNCFYQLEYFAWIIREAVWFREKQKFPPLELHVNYYGDDFLKDLNEGRWGEETKSWVKLLIRQFEKQCALFIYKDFKLIKTIKKESQLKFTR